MSKLTDSLNQIWYEQEGRQIKVGLTSDFLNQLDECWHILPAHSHHIKEKSPLLTVETNDGLMSILSPVSGNVLRWETRATNFPDKLTSNDIILVLTSENLEVKPKAVREPEGPQATPGRQLFGSAAPRRPIWDAGIINTATAQQSFVGNRIDIEAPPVTMNNNHIRTITTRREAESFNDWRQRENVSREAIRVPPISISDAAQVWARQTVQGV